MDQTLKKLADFAFNLKYDDLPPDAVHECKRRLIDTLACALGGFHAQPSQIARAMAERTTSRRPARILGTLQESSPELAAFANTVMMRYLDLNDAQGNGGGHPSDALGALLAASELGRTDGKTFIASVAVAYEVFLSFFEAIRVGSRGFDHAVYIVLSAAAGVAKILRLDHQKTAHALALALTPNMALGVVRRGQLSMWKACAGANASRNAIFAGQLAAEGMTGPESVFEGENGVWQVTGNFDWPRFGGRERRFRITDIQTKIYPCVYPGQSPVEAMLAIRSRIDPAEVERITVRTYRSAWFEAGSEPAKWAPSTRETADHSIPFLVSAALLDGRIDAATFGQDRIFDPRLRSLMQTVQVLHDETLDQVQQENNSNPCRMEVLLKSGERKLSSVDYPKGHAKNPASDRDIEQKLIGLNNELLSPDGIARLLDLCWRLEQLDDMAELVAATRI
jgi:2-methylcitrate dehydratase